jgi:hypothetical protein
MKLECLISQLGGNIVALIRSSAGEEIEVVFTVE